MMDREQLLNELMQIDFARYDLRLYLDTHPSDREAIQQYNNLTKEVNEFRKEYEKQYGPLTHMDFSDENCFMWIDDPWPWQR